MLEVGNGGMTTTEYRAHFSFVVHSCGAVNGGQRSAQHVA